MTQAQKHTIGLTIYPRMTLIDFAGPHQVFNLLPNQQIHRIWKTINPIETEEGLKIIPDTISSRTDSSLHRRSEIG